MSSTKSSPFQVMTADDPLQRWLTDRGLEKYWQTLVDNDVGFDLVADLNEADLRQLGLSLGDRKRFLKAVTGAAIIRC